MKIDKNNKFSYQTNDEFEDLSEFDIAEEQSDPVFAENEEYVQSYEPEEVYDDYQEGEAIVGRGIAGSIDIRQSFIERLSEMDENVIRWHDELQAHLVTYRKVKSRYSARCDSYRCGRELLAKMAIGGKTLKLYLALDPDDAALEDGKYHQRNLSETSAYQEVPFMLPIRSDLAVRKACRVIDYMMENFQIPKRRPRKKRKQADQ